MVVQSGQHRTAVRVEHLLGVQWVQAVGDFDDALVDPEVGDVSIRQPAAGESACGEPGFDQFAHTFVIGAEVRQRARRRRNPRWLVDVSGRGGERSAA